MPEEVEENTGDDVDNDDNNSIHGSSTDSSEGEQEQQEVRTEHGPDLGMTVFCAKQGPHTGTAVSLGGDSECQILEPAFATETKSDPLENIISEAANHTFRFKPFIVLESELEKDREVATLFFKKMKLSTDTNEDTEEKVNLWVNKKCKNRLRRKHQRRRNNISQKIYRAMESK